MQPLKRHPDFIKHSQQHHQTLSLCLHLLRQPTSNHRIAIEQQRPDLLAHFLNEETQFASYGPRLNQPTLQQCFESEHAYIRALLAAPRYDDADLNTELATRLRAHIRFEERQLFSALETVWP